MGQKQPLHVPQVRFAMDKSGSERTTKDMGERFVTDKYGPEEITKIQGYDLLWIRMDQKDPPVPAGTICYG